MIPWFTLALATSGAVAQDLPAGEPVAEGLDVQVGAAGLDAVADILPSLLPDDVIDVGDVSDSTGFGCLGNSYSLSNLWVVAQIIDASITPKASGELELVVDLMVQVNGPTDEFTLDIEAICLIDENCDGHILPFPLTVVAPVTLDVVGAPGSRTLSAHVGATDISSSLSSTELQIGCAIEDIESVLNIFGLSIFDLILTLFEDTLVDQITGPLNDGLAALAIDEELDVSGALVQLKLEPAGVEVSATGLEIVLSALAATDTVASCVARYDPGGSVASYGARPELSSNPAGTHVGAHVHTDFANQALYALWQSGLLCEELGGPGSDLDLGGFPIDTGLLSLLAGGAFDELFPEVQPMVLATLPRIPPTAEAGGTHDLDVVLDDFELNFYGELDGRLARALGVGLDGAIGVDLRLDDTTGNLGVDIGVDQGNLVTALASDPMVPDAEQLAAGLGPVLAGLLDSVVGGLVGDALAFPLPAFEGVGVTELSADASGPSDDWVGLYAQIGPVDWYDPAAGCACDAEGESDCGCNATRGSMVVWLSAMVVVAVRRRRRS